MEGPALLTLCERKHCLPVTTLSTEHPADPTPALRWQWGKGMVGSDK